MQLSSVALLLSLGLLMSIAACGSASGETALDPEIQLYQNDFSCSPPEPTPKTSCESTLAKNESLAMTPRCAPSYLYGVRQLADAGRLEMLAALVSGEVVAKARTVRYGFRSLAGQVERER